jgi:threonine dehydratase
MTQTLSRETFSSLEDAEPVDLDAEWAALAGSTLPTERLGDNPAALAIWNELVPLLNGSEHAERFSEFVPATPVLRVPEDALPTDLQNSEHQLYLAADGYMPTGAYKFRGVMNALLEKLERKKNLREAVAASTGNHSGAIALASTLLGLESTVFMPEGAVTAKVDNSLQYGAQVQFAPSLDVALHQAKVRGARRKSTFVHPFDRRTVIAGQGTMAANLPRQMSLHGVDLSTQSADLYEPAGGGGVAAGNAVAAKAMLPHTRLHVVQAEHADALVAQLENRDFDHASFNSAVDGAAVPNPGNIARQVLGAPGFIHGRHVVSRGQIGEAMAVTSRFTDIYEPAGALALAAAMAEMRADPDGKSVKIAHGTGINTTPQKVQEFAAEAVRAGLLSEPEAFALVSLANVNRRREPNEIEERGLALTALRQRSVTTRSGTRIMSGWLL